MSIPPTFNMLIDALLLPEIQAKFVAVGFALLATWFLRYLLSPVSTLPLVNEHGVFNLGRLSSRKSFVTGAADLIKDGFAKVGSHMSEVYPRYSSQLFSTVY